MSELLAEYRSHKLIRAGKIIKWNIREPNTVIVEDYNGEECKIEMPTNAFARGKPNLGDYIVIYSDGYRSWSPAKVFEEGYSRI